MRRLIFFVLAACGNSQTHAASVDLAPAAGSGSHVDAEQEAPAGNASTRAPRRPKPGTILDERVYGHDETNSGALAIDADGNRYVMGSFRGQATFGDLPALTSRGYDAYLVKIDRAGKPVWQKQFGGAGPDYGQDVVIGADGNVYASGAFESASIDLGGGSMRCAGVHDLFLGKFDRDGKLLWQKRYGDALDQIDMHLRRDPSGGVAAVGWFNGTVDFGSGPTASPFVQSTFVTRIDDAGRGRWSKVFGHRIDFAGADAAFDSKGNLWVSGGSDGMSDFVPGGKPSTTHDLGPVLLSFDPKGKRLSAKRFGDGSDNLSTAIAVDADDNLVLVTSARGRMDFGAGNVTPPRHESASVVSKFDGAGALLWSVTLGTYSIGGAGDVLLDPRGNVFVTGAFLDPEDASHARSNGFVTKLDPSGRVVWKVIVKRGIRASVGSPAFDPEGHLVVTGGVSTTDGNRLMTMTFAP